MQGPRVVPASLIQHEDRVNAGLKLVSKVLQKDRHRIGIHPRQRQREGLARAGPAGGEQIQVLEALIDDPGRAPARSYQTRVVRPFWPLRITLLRLRQQCRSALGIGYCGPKFVIQNER